MKIFAPAKINLCLHVSAPIKDGQYKNYHALDSLVVHSNEIGDAIEFFESDDLSLEIIGEFANELLQFPIDDNLILKVANQLKRQFNIKMGAKIILNKSLPIASGIGGGSADCAAVLNGLCEFWNIAIDLTQKQNIAQIFGADTMACLDNNPKIMRGIGDILQESPQLPPRIYGILANPLKACPTPQIYRAYDNANDFSKEFAINYHDCHQYDDLIVFLRQTRNDLEPIACHEIQEINDLLAALKVLPNCDLARMSGSGASCFALFANQELAQNGLDILKDKYKNNKLWAKSQSFNGIKHGK